ncbi:MAG: 3-phosphoshikimate 1-carboxyvinyltransferase [Anaerolineae bacterium]|nr:3-phosphoshikimate 1-carboxyvinyltransferase [Anaerolineae bacterium]
MSELEVRPGGALRGTISVPGDKSISHRALMLGALANGASHVRGLLPGGDCLATLACMRALGVEIEVENESVSSIDVTIHGRGLRGLQAPAAPLDCARSGTTMRLLAGILAGQAFDSVLTGDPQLLRRPMRRVVEPLRAMGADIQDTDGHAPLNIRGRALRGCKHTLAVASAQVKSALLLAGLFADGATLVQQPGPARDHTERMLGAQIANGRSAGEQVSGLANHESRIMNQESPVADPQSNIQHPISSIQHPLLCEKGVITLDPALIDYLNPLDMAVPGDISSAAFPVVAAILVPGSEITLTGVNVNPTRTGLLEVLAEMGAEIGMDNVREQGGEPVADLVVRAASLVGTEIGGDTVVRMIDEFPILAVAATQAEGRTVVRDAAELRVKETDRVAVVVEELRKMGATIEAREDGFVVEGPTQLRGAVVSSHDDHRLGMALAVAGLIAQGETVIEHAERIADSFPGFVEGMTQLGGAMTEVAV